MAFLSPACPPMRPVRQRAIATARLQLPTPAVAQSRIIDVWNGASLADHAEGESWYSTAQSIATDVGLALDGPLELGAGIIAATSPQTAWDVNIEIAYDIAGDPEARHPYLMADVQGKVDRILAGNDPSAVLGGRKVRSFYSNIRGYTSPVTVDRHAFNIVAGYRAPQSVYKAIERPGVYQYLAANYRAVARTLGVPASTLQAVTWIAWRRTA